VSTLRLISLEVDEPIAGLFTQGGDGVRVSYGGQTVLNPKSNTMFMGPTEAFPWEFTGGPEDTHHIDGQITLTLVAGGTATPLQAFDVSEERGTIVVAYDYGVMQPGSGKGRFYIRLTWKDLARPKFSIKVRMRRSAFQALQLERETLKASSRRYLVLPGNYSGDSWACAACLLLDPDIRVVIPTKSDKFFDEVTNQFLEFCAHLKIEEERVIRVNSLQGLQQVSERNVATCAADAIEKDLGPLKLNPPVGWTFASSSVIARHAEVNGASETLKVLSRFAKATDIYAEAFNTLDNVGPCVLVNMRIGRKGNHPQHDINPAIYEQIRLAAKAVGRTVVRIGAYQDEDNTPGGDWMNKLEEPWIELFPPKVRVSRASTAFFWHSVASRRNVFGVIGGRSGSLDIASFMGVRTLCWDVVDVDDHEYVRQFLYRQLQSLCPRDGMKKVTEDVKNKKKKYPGQLLDMFLRQWFTGGGLVVPTHGTGSRYGSFPSSIVCPVPRLNQLTGSGSDAARKRLMLDKVQFMERYTATD
jgi:hypothetical protein